MLGGTHVSIRFYKYISTPESGTQTFRLCLQVEIKSWIGGAYVYKFCKRRLYGEDQVTSGGYINITSSLEEYLCCGYVFMIQLCLFLMQRGGCLVDLFSSLNYLVEMVRGVLVIYPLALLFSYMMFMYMFQYVANVESFFSQLS